jgi:adenine-specific DNA-methyltransferase
MYWRFSKERFLELDRDNRIWWGKDKNNQPRLKRFLSDVMDGVVPQTIWFHTDVGNTQEAKKEVLAVLPNVADVFQTTKPERLLRQVLEIASMPGDLVLDSFLGSGTTAAVAHKMGRRYIGIEMGEHAATHCLPRLEKVIEGEQGGISGAVGWKGGGGFQFVKLGETMFDERGAINPKVRFSMLASFIWSQETGLPSDAKFKSPLLGAYNGTAYYLLFNGILGDKRADKGNVLTGAVLRMIEKKFPHVGPKVIYGKSCRLGSARLAAASVAFRHIPYDVKAK